MLASVLVLASLFSAVSASCDNSCSGHGVCGQRGVCECYDNWGLGLSHLSGDCSERICPFEFAWVDNPDSGGAFHKYAECSNRGLCNRDSGECECFPGYEGKGCQRTACPNDCSGHGRCAYIEDMSYSAVANDYYNNYFSYQDAATFNYYSWDRGKTRGCVCDPEYGDVDCSKRMCQHGTDIMDQRDDITTAAKYQTQMLTFVADLGDLDLIGDKTFALTFKSQLNETFTTVPIKFYNPIAGGTFNEFILDVQTALHKLPNRVIDRVEVHGSRDALQATLNITFTGEHVQGPQNLLTVRSILCGDGCTPKLTGMELYAKEQNITEVQLSDFNSYECGRRGKCDYDTGICNCFAGYTGLSCGTITALV